MAIQTIKDVLESAFGDLSILADEMQEAFDNTPESLQGSTVGEARGVAAETLSSLVEPTITETIGNMTLEVRTGKPKKRPSRSDRRDEAVSHLQQVLDFLNEIEDPDDDVQGTVSDLENAIGQAEEVEFPGMYG